MKPLRIVHLLFGALALTPLIWIGTALILPPFQNAESSRSEGLQGRLKQELQAYRRAASLFAAERQAPAVPDYEL